MVQAFVRCGLWVDLACWIDNELTDDFRHSVCNCLRVCDQLRLGVWCDAVSCDAQALGLAVDPEFRSPEGVHRDVVALKQGGCD